MKTYIPPVAGKLPRQLGEGQRAAEREQPARDPDRHERKRTGQLVRDPGGRAEDSGADRRADQNGDGAPEAELALEGHRVWYGRDGMRTRLELQLPSSG